MPTLDALMHVPSYMYACVVCVCVCVWCLCSSLCDASAINNAVCVVFGALGCTCECLFGWLLLWFGLFGRLVWIGFVCLCVRVL